jgi:MFS family permease
VTPGARPGSSSLDALNFCLADVRDGLGPYLAIYLLTVQHWDQAAIGAVMSLAGLATIVAQAPAGALVDRTRAKRAVIVAAAVAVTAAAFVLPLAPDPIAVGAAQAIGGAAAAAFPPAIAAVTLGLVGRADFARRVGRNEAFNHAGNATAALLAGGAAYLVGPIAVFWLMALMALASIAASASIPAGAIDHRIARGLDGPDRRTLDRPSGWRVLLRCRPLLIFAGCTTAFHLANAAMLPLVGQKLALANQQLGTSLVAACIVAAQVVMVPVAWLVGSKADAWGRKPLFAAGFLVLAVRGALYPLADDPAWLVGVQLLDGVGAGAFGALFPLVVEDLTRGTGHFNVSLGAIATAQGLGAALSNGAAGMLVARAGYDSAFLALAGTAAVGLVIWLVAMPETRAAAVPARAPAFGRG